MFVEQFQATPGLLIILFENSALHLEEVSIRLSESAGTREQRSEAEKIL